MLRFRLPDNLAAAGQVVVGLARRLPRIAFQSLGTRLAVQFALLFTVAMMGVASALSILVAHSLSQQVENELRTSGAVFDRLWQQRADELGAAGALLARDFGFREAVATGDEATMQSALDNIRARARVTGAFIVGVDGRVHGLTDPAARADAEQLLGALDDGQRGGVALLGGRMRQLVAAPIMSPQLTGWLVLAADIDQTRLNALEQLSAVPLHAAVILRNGASWSTNSGVVSASVARHLVDRHDGLFELPTADGGALSLAKAIPTVGSDRQAVLLLTYPKKLAYSQQRELLGALAILTLLGLIGVAVVTWRAAGRITHPLARLDDAAARIAAGASERVTVSGSDELARLGRTFNHMATEIEERERRITHLAFNDTLTGLANRSLFQEHLALQLRNCAAGDAIAIHCLDLDNFKAINDTMGHPAGDMLLVETAARLTGVAQGHFVARLSGDEFVVVQAVGTDRIAVDRLARALLEGLSQPFSLDGHQVQPSASLGIAVYPADGDDPHTLLKNADLALYRAKENGRGTYAYFEEELNERAQRRRQIEADLRSAIREGQFELYFQPLLDLATGEVSSFEALIRWHHPTRGMVSPLDFIPIAEESGLILPIGEWVLRQACREAARWPESVRVAVNVSSIQFHRGGIIETVFQAIAASGIAPERLEIELTESVFLEGDAATLAALHGLRALGVRIALDDFGTGYSSLSYLQSFPFDKLKIDQSFIRNLLTKPGASAVVRAIIDLAAALGMETTAEGVEDSGQLEALRQQGCSTVQGYHFSRPVNAEAASDLLTTMGKMVNRAIRS